MKENNILDVSGVDKPKESLTIDEIARIGAQTMLKVALEAEIKVYLASISKIKCSDGKRAIVRNGYHKERPVTVGSGTIPVKVPRTRNRSGTEEHFSSSIVPSYMRRSLSINDAIPLLYLNGISTNLMVFKLTERASKRLLKLNGSSAIESVISGVKFVDGEKVNIAA